MPPSIVDRAFAVMSKIQKSSWDIEDYFLDLEFAVRQEMSYLTDEQILLLVDKFFFST